MLVTNGLPEFCSDNCKGLTTENFLVSHQQEFTDEIIFPWQPGANVTWENYWSPKIFIENAVGDPKVTQSRMLDFDENGEAWVIDRRRVKGEFIEQLELWEFPFDVQVRKEIIWDRSQQPLCLRIA